MSAALKFPSTLVRDVMLDEIGYSLHAQTRVQATDALIASSRQLKFLYTELAALNASRRIFSLTGGPTDCSSFLRAFASRLSIRSHPTL
jgi:hypothetical protein